MWENRPRAVAGVAGFPLPPTLDKTMSDRKHLVSAEVEKLLLLSEVNANSQMLMQMYKSQ